jgi:hypothetical protein
MIPADFPVGGTLQVECFGAASYNNYGGYNSGGGAYSKTNAITGLTAGQTVYVQVGSPSANNGSWFNKTSNTQPTTTTNGCYAQSGAQFTYGQSNPSGGLAGNGVGDVKYSGGTGGAWASGGCCANDGYGGSGGAAGPNGNGANAYIYIGGGGGANGGSAGTSTTGGNGRGGSGGGAYSASGTAGNGTNGGGGGATSIGTPGLGGIDFLYTDFAGVQWGPCGGGGGNNNGNAGLGGGAGKTAGASGGLVVLTYTTGTASTYVDAVPGSYSTTSAYQGLGYYYVPYGVTNLKVEAIGSSTSGGGAAYASRTINVTPGGVLYLSVNSSPYSSSADTWVSTTNSKPTIDSSTVVLAKGSTSATGGQASASFGVVKYSGGNKGLYNSPGFGGAAGPNGAGANGGNSYSNLGSISAGGGGGGANGGSAGANIIGSAISDGGSGGNNRFGSGGGAGAVDATDSNATNGTNGGGGGGGGYYNNPDPEGSGPLNSGLGSQENIWTTTNGIVYGPSGGAGGAFYPGGFTPSPAGASYGAYQGAIQSGFGLIIFTSAGSTNTGAFLQFF